MRTNSQNKLLHYLLGKLNIGQEVKEDLVYQFTNGKAKSSSEMSKEECQSLINHLNHLKRETRLAPSGQKTFSSPEDRMRKKILSICHEMNWKKDDGRIDMNRVNDFCEKRGKYKKKLDAHTSEELRILITQFEKVLKEFYGKG
jgi:hypothetical protein